MESEFKLDLNGYVYLQFEQPGDRHCEKHFSLSVYKSCLNSAHTKLIVRQGGRKGAEGKRGVSFHEDSLAAVKHWIYVPD